MNGGIIGNFFFSKFLICLYNKDSIGMIFVKWKNLKVLNIEVKKEKVRKVFIGFYNEVIGDL